MQQDDPYSENELDFLAGPLSDSDVSPGCILIDDTANFPYEMMDIKQRIFSGTRFRRHIRQWMATHQTPSALFYFLPELSENFPG